MPFNSGKIDLECLVNTAIALWPTVADFAKGKVVDATYKLAKKGLTALVNETKKHLGIDPLTKIFNSARELFPPDLLEKGLLTSLRRTFEILTKEHRRFTKEAFIEVASDPKYEIGIPANLVLRIYDHVASRLANYFIAIKGKDEKRFREFVVKQLGTETGLSLTQVTPEDLTTLERHLTDCFISWGMTWETFQDDIKKGQITILDTLGDLTNILNA